MPMQQGATHTPAEYQSHSGFFLGHNNMIRLKPNLFTLHWRFLLCVSMLCANGTDANLRCQTRDLVPRTAVGTSQPGGANGEHRDSCCDIKVMFLN